MISFVLGIARDGFAVSRARSGDGIWMMIFSYPTPLVANLNYKRLITTLRLASQSEFLKELSYDAAGSSFFASTSLRTAFMKSSCTQ